MLAVAEKQTKLGQVWITLDIWFVVIEDLSLYVNKLNIGGAPRANTTPMYLTIFIRGNIILPTRDLDFPEQVCYTSPEE